MGLLTGMWQECTTDAMEAWRPHTPRACCRCPRAGRGLYNWAGESAGAQPMEGYPCPAPWERREA